MGRMAGWRFNLACAAGLALIVWSLSVIQDLWVGNASVQGGSAKVWILDVNSEEGVFTWMSILALASAAAILFSLSQVSWSSSRERVVWFGLSLLFALLSFDEFYGLHERMGSLIAGMLDDSSGLPHFFWAVPAGLISLAGLALLLPFLRSLGRRTATLMLVSALAYLSGAVGSELLGGALAGAYSENSLPYRIAVNLEEALEMAGILLFVFALLDFRERGAAR